MYNASGRIQGGLDNSVFFLLEKYLLIYSKVYKKWSFVPYFQEMCIK